MTAFDKNSRNYRGQRDADDSPVDTPDCEGNAQKIHIKEEERYRRDRESH